MNGNENNAKKNVVIINSKGGGGDFNRAVRMANSLLSHGYKAEILTWNRTNSRLNSDNINMHMFGYNPQKYKPLGLICGYLYWWLFVLNFIISNSYVDIYHAQGFFGFIPVLPICLIKKKKVVYDLIDFVADSFMWPSPAKELIAFLENTFLNLASAVILVDSRKQKIDISKINNFTVVTNCPVDLLEKFSKKINKNKNGFLIYYGGALYKVRGLENVCEAVKGLEDVKVVIAGAGNDENELKLKYAAQSNIEFKGLLSPIESLMFTFKANLIPIFYDPKIPIHKMASPAKLYDAMMCKTAVMVNCEALTVSETVKNENCGLIIPYKDINALRDTIIKLKDDGYFTNTLAINGRLAFEREFNWDVMESRLVNLYDKLSI